MIKTLKHEKLSTKKLEFISFNLISARRSDPEELVQKYNTAKEKDGFLPVPLYHPSTPQVHKLF